MNPDAVCDESGMRICVDLVEAGRVEHRPCRCEESDGGG